MRGCIVGPIPIDGLPTACQHVQDLVPGEVGFNLVVRKDYVPTALVRIARIKIVIMIPAHLACVIGNVVEHTISQSIPNDEIDWVAPPSDSLLHERKDIVPPVLSNVHLEKIVGLTGCKFRRKVFQKGKYVC